LDFSSLSILLFASPLSIKDCSENHFSKTTPKSSKSSLMPLRMLSIPTSNIDLKPSPNRSFDLAINSSIWDSLSPPSRPSLQIPSKTKVDSI